MITNQTVNINSQCQVVFFNWQNKFANNSLSLSDLSASTVIDVSKYVQEVSFSKNLGDPAGTFSIRLPNDRDWKQVLQVGAWGIIYMSQGDALAIPEANENVSGSDNPQNFDPVSLDDLRAQKDKVRGIVFIDRISATGKIGEERGEFDVDFIVSGRDYGVVYVENEIWYNRLYAEGKIQDAAFGALESEGIKTIDNLLTILHQAFFSPQDLPGITLESDSVALSIPLQWLMPIELIQVLDLSLKSSSGNKPYYGNIEDLLDFDETLCSYPVDNPMTLINGKAWDRLKSNSIEQFHELFVETDDQGHPKLKFRYIPWKTSDGSTLGKLDPLVKSLSSAIPDEQVDQVSINSIDIVDFDLGEDNHNRYNLFFTTPDTSLFSANSTMADIQDISPQTGFPRIQSNSIRRYGLRLMYSTINALIQQGNEKVDPDLLRLHNELMLEYWNNSVFMESGSMTLIGRNDVKIGKALAVDTNVPYNGGKVYYIEGYTDQFVVDDKGAGLWTQTLTLTRGYFPDSIGNRGQDYVDNGEFTRK